MKERTLFTFGTVATGIVFFYIPSLLLHVMAPYLQRYKINKDKNPPPELVWECMKVVTMSNFLFNPVYLYFLYPAFVYFGMNCSEELPGWREVANGLFWGWVCNQIGFYVTHRILHHKSLYWIHKQHHEFNYSIGFAAEYAHPIEGLFSNAIPTVLGPLLCGSHCTVLWFWLAIRLLETTSNHSGFDWPWTWFFEKYHFYLWPLMVFLPLSQSARWHDYHHTNNNGNFGGPLTDWAFGTDKNYYEWMDKKKYA